MLDFEIRRSARKCAKTDREFQPGETVYSLLVAEGAEVIRHDYCQEAWAGPPENALAWWKSLAADPGGRKVHLAPNDVILQYFEQLAGQVEKADMRYVLTLLMIRRRIVRLEDTESDEAGGEHLVVFCPRNEVEYRVPVVTPNATRAAAIQEELAKLLYADAA